MSTSNRTITIRGIKVQVVRKDIKNLHLAVYPPEGRVRVAVPLHVSDDNVRLAVISKLAWIKKHQASFMEQPRQSERDMVIGESHYFFGKHYRLEVKETWGKHQVKLKNNTKLLLMVHPDTTVENRRKVLNEYYRAELKKRIPKFIKRWEPKIGVKVSDWGVKKMKTRWGSCNTSTKRIWLNLELAKKPLKCLEFILVHEMIHLLERHHNENFRALMNYHLPQWKSHRTLLNSSPLSHEDWSY